MAMDEGVGHAHGQAGPGIGPSSRTGAVPGRDSQAADRAYACADGTRRASACSGSPRCCRHRACARRGRTTTRRIACDAAETLWLTERTDHIEVIERNLREKVIEPDFRYPMMDGRLALARLCALQRRYDEAVEWFAKARTVLDEQGARPLRAIVDYDEALMYARRGAAGDPERARPLLDAALRQFRTLGMPGWIRRAEALLKSCAARGARAEEHSQ